MAQKARNHMEQRGMHSYGMKPEITWHMRPHEWYKP